MQNVQAGWPLLLGSLLLSGVSCRAQTTLAEPPTAPEAPSEPPAGEDARRDDGELAKLEEQLRANERALLAQLGARAPEAKAEPQGGVAPSSQPAGPRTSRPAGRPTQQQSPELGEMEAAPTASPCTIACRALASMRRAAEGICRLTGEEQARCVRARERVARADQQAANSGCLCTEPYAPLR
ncbi:MAG: hypothetical protein MUF54_13255 [Polyangiaceae bacterium]|jgi:hypothetical protein|nr:hypothetical protein [Polyangiaceae bacterium]